MAMVKEIKTVRGSGGVPVLDIVKEDVVAPQGEIESGLSRQKRGAGERVVPNAARVFIASWYLTGCFVHIHFALTNTHVYEAFGKTALLVVFRELWTSIIMPHIVFFALLLATFEMTTGILILSKSSWVKVGLAASVLFNLFLVQLGLSRPASDWETDLLANRLPDLLLALLQLPLFWVHFDKSLLQLLHTRLR